MNDISEIMIGNALVVTPLSVALFAVSRVWHRPAVLHFLWVMLLAKLLIPPLLKLDVFLPSVEWVNGMASQVEPIDLQDGPSLSPAASAAPNVPVVSDRPSAPEYLIFEIVSPEVLTAKKPKKQNRNWHWLGTVACTGTLLYVMLFLYRTGRFRKLVQNAVPAHEHAKTVRRLARELRLRRVPEVVLVAGRVPPMVAGIGPSTRIILPSELFDRMDEGARRTLLLHELAHVARRDHWVRYLEVLVTALYWWHPVVWLARRELREAEEACCDAWVVQSNPESVRIYATALLDTVDFLAGARPILPPVVSGAGPIHSLRRRIEMVMRATTRRSWSWTSRLLVAAMAICVVPLGATWAEEGAESVGEGELNLEVSADAVVTTEANVATDSSNSTTSDVFEYSNSNADSPLEGLRFEYTLSSDILDDVGELFAQNTNENSIGQVVEIQNVLSDQGAVSRLALQDAQAVETTKFTNKGKPVAITIEFEDGSKRRIEPAAKGNLLIVDAEKGSLTVFNRETNGDGDTPRVRRRRLTVSSSDSASDGTITVEQDGDRLILRGSKDAVDSARSLFQRSRNQLGETEEEEIDILQPEPKLTSEITSGAISASSSAGHESNAEATYDDSPSDRNNRLNRLERMLKELGKEIESLRDQTPAPK